MTLIVTLQQKGEGVTIIDAGGGTIDISAYASADKGKTFDEIAEPQCKFVGRLQTPNSDLIARRSSQRLHLRDHVRRGVSG